MVISENQSELLISVIRISNIADLTDFLILVKQIDFPISVIRLLCTMPCATGNDGRGLMMKDPLHLTFDYFQYLIRSSLSPILSLHLKEIEQHIFLSTPYKELRLYGKVHVSSCAMLPVTWPHL